MANIESRLQALEQRVGRVEDELSIRNVLVRYGLAVDTGNPEATADTFTNAAEYDIGPLVTGGSSPVTINNREGIVNDLVLGAAHQRLLPNCAHTIGPIVVHVNKDGASAVGYSRIYHRDRKQTEGNRFRLFRLGLNRWALVRSKDGDWKVAKRSSRVLGNKNAHRQLVEGLREVHGHQQSFT